MQGYQQFVHRDPPSAWKLAHEPWDYENVGPAMFNQSEKGSPASREQWGIVNLCNTWGKQAGISQDWPPSMGQATPF